MSKTIRLVILVTGLILLSVAFALLLVKLNVFSSSKATPRYAAVYLTTGDIYFGKLSGFDKFRLSNVVYIQKDSEGKLGVQKFKDSVWQPKEPMYIPKEQVIFWTYLEPTSPVIQFAEGTVPANQPATETPVLPSEQKSAPKE